MEQTYMKEKPVLPLLLSMAIPMMLSMLVNSLYNIIDSIFVSKISEDAMTALSLVYPVQNLISSIGVGFGIGVNAVIAMALGAHNQERADAAATQGLFLNIIHGALYTIFGILAMPAFLRLFTDAEQVLDLGLRYSNIVLMFSVIITAEITFEKIFQSVGRMVVSMLSMLSGCIINIILDPLLIFGIGIFPAMGIEGAAWATNIGQLTTLIIYLIAWLVRPLNLRLSVRHLKPTKDICIPLYLIGIPATLNMGLPSVLVSALNSILAAFSQTHVLVLGIYYKLQTFLYLPSNGVVQGMRPLLSYNFGAREFERVNKIYKTALVLILLIMAMGMVLCLCIPAQLIGMFTENPATIQLGIPALRIICLGFIISSLSIVSSGALEALGEGPKSLIISTLRYVILIIPAAFLLSRFFGAVGVWNSFWASETVTAVLAYLIYRKCISQRTLNQPSSDESATPE